MRVVAAVAAAVVASAILVAVVFVLPAEWSEKNGDGDATPRPTDEADVPAGYRGLAWGTKHDEVAKKHPDARPGKKDPTILVRDEMITGKPATEAYFFDGDGGLVEVEVRYVPKLAPLETATLGINMDKMFGAHLVTHTDDDGYQYAWIGETTEIRVTYDLREEIPFGPVISYTKREAEPEASAAPSGSPASPLLVPSGAPGSRFAAAVRAARAENKRLSGVEAGHGRLTLIYGGAMDAVDITLTSDPKSGKLIGSAFVPRGALDVEPLKRAEAALDGELERGDPIRLTFGGPAGLKTLVTLVFPGERFISFDPTLPDPLVSVSQPAPSP